MIIDDKNKQILMEARDINFIIPQYIRQYLFAMRNEDPIKIVFPKFPSAPHPHKPGVKIPIEYIEIDSQKAAEIAKDGSNVPETPQAVEEVAEPESDKQSGGEEDGMGSQSAEAQDDKDIGITENGAKEGEPISIQGATQEHKSIPRQPKQPPGGDIGSGHPDGMQSRDARLDSKIAADLKPEPQVAEDKEIPTEIEKPK